MGNLKKHKESIHGGVKYQCDRCDYAATKQRNLKKHKKMIMILLSICVICVTIRQQNRVVFIHIKKLFMKVLSTSVICLIGICVIGMTMQLHSRVIFRNIK